MLANRVRCDFRVLHGERTQHHVADPSLFYQPVDIRVGTDSSTHLDRDIQFRADAADDLSVVRLLVRKRGVKVNQMD